MRIPNFRKIIQVCFNNNYKIYNTSILQGVKAIGSKLQKKQVLSTALAIMLGGILSIYGIYKIETKQPKQVFSIVDNRAEELFFEGNYESSIEEYINILEQDGDSPIWYMKIAEVYSVRGDIENSKKFITKAKEVRVSNISDKKDILYADFSKKDAEVANYIVFTELMNKDFGQALKDGEEALNKYRDDKKLIKTMLTVYMANGQGEKAKDLIANYPLDKTSAYDVAEQARMKMLLNQWDDGLAQLKEAWNIDKDEYKVFDVIAQIAAYNKDNILEKITELSSGSPQEPAYKMWLAKIYSMREETSELAQDLLDEVNGNDIGKIEKTLIQAAILKNTELVEEADKLISNLIIENENDYRVLHTAGWYYLQKNDIDKSIVYCKKSIAKNKNYPDNYGFLMPEILKAMEKVSEGEPYFRTALLKEPYNYNIMLTLANYYYYTSKDSEKALEYFRFAEIVKQDDPEIKYNMALIYLTNEKHEEAIRLLNSAIGLDPAVPKYHRTLGTINMMLGKYDEAIKEIRNAYEADKEDILTLNNAGCYYITVEAYLERGEYNLRKAYEGINETTDDYTKKTIIENYEKAKKLLDDYTNVNGGELKVPDFVLFY